MSAVIDASALIAFLRDEPGPEAVENVLGLPQACYAHALDLCEVYYDFWRASNQNAAEAAIVDLMGLGIEERTDMDSEFWREVGRLKAVHRKVSLADCCALAKRLDANLVSADRTGPFSSGWGRTAGRSTTMLSERNREQGLSRIVASNRQFSLSLILPAL